MGKTASGAVWLDPNKTSPFDFYQYWRNVDDAEVDGCMKMLTFIPLDQIHEMEKWPGERVNEKKEVLAFELTRMVHGEEEAIKAKEAAKSLFSGNADSENMPKEEIEVNQDTGLLDVMVLAKLTQSKGEARRLIEQGGVSIDNEKVINPNEVISLGKLKAGVIIKKGKKVFLKVIAK